MWLSSSGRSGLSRNHQYQPRSSTRNRLPRRNPSIPGGSRLAPGSRAYGAGGGPMELLSRVYTLDWVSTIRGEVQSTESMNDPTFPLGLGSDLVVRYSCSL